MNNDKRTTRERAIEWWEGLTHSLERDNLNKKYFPFSSLASITYPNIEHIYLSEHPEPIKPVVDVLEGKIVSDALTQWDNVGYDNTDSPKDTYLAGAKYIGIPLAKENKSLREANKRMKEALEKIICEDGEYRDADQRYMIAKKALQANP